MNGGRSAYFDAERDLWQILKSVIKLSQNKELVPFLNLLECMVTIEANCPNSSQFKILIQGMPQYTRTVDDALTSFANMDSEALISTIFETEQSNDHTN